MRYNGIAIRYEMMMGIQLRGEIIAEDQGSGAATSQSQGQRHTPGLA